MTPRYVVRRMWIAGGTTNDGHEVHYYSRNKEKNGFFATTPFDESVKDFKSWDNARVFLKNYVNESQYDTFNIYFIDETWA